MKYELGKSKVLIIPLGVFGTVRGFAEGASADTHDDMWLVAFIDEHGNARESWWTDASIETDRS